MRLLLAILLLLLAGPAWAQQGQGMSKALVVSSCGGGALPNGPLTNLTMNPQGQLCLVGISGGGGCSQATAYLARTTGGNEGGNATNITTLICGLVTDGVWANLDALYVLAQQNEPDAKLNLIGTSYSLTQNGSFGVIAPHIGTIVFTSYVGFSGFNTASSYFDTGFNPATATSPHFVQNSANFGVWSYNSTAAGGVEIGTDTGAAGLSNLLTSYSPNVFYARVNASGAPGITNPGTKGLYVGDRSSSASLVQYWNGASQATPSSTSVAPFSADFVISLASVPTSQTLSEAHIGASLGAAGNLALYTRLRTYMTAVGVP